MNRFAFSIASRSAAIDRSDGSSGQVSQDPQRSVAHVLVANRPTGCLGGRRIRITMNILPNVVEKRSRGGFAPQE